MKIGSEATLSTGVQGAVSVSAPAVFAGYGLVVPGLGLKDGQGVDLHGKIAVVLAGAPTVLHGRSRHTSALRVRFGRR